jgi:hypothetical protein
VSANSSVDHRKSAENSVISADEAVVRTVREISGRSCRTLDIVSGAELPVGRRLGSHGSEQAAEEIS